MTTFVKRPPWRLWCELVVREVKGEASIEDAHLLRERDSLIAWVRALNQVKLDAQTHDADARLRLRTLCPVPGAPASAAYLDAKREFEWRHAARVRFLRGVEARLEECKHLLDVAGLDWHQTVGNLLATLVKAEELLLRDDLDAALGLVRSVLARARRDEEAS